MPNITIRTIQEADNAALATIIRNSLEEFKANKPGTVYFDPTTDNLFEVFKTAKSKYFVAVENDTILGGGGIYPTQNLPADTCELVKLYVDNTARGKGIGRLLMEACFAATIQLGYTKIYLESMPELNIAVPLYEKLGFTYLPAPMGNSGHHGCDIWMIKHMI